MARGLKHVDPRRRAGPLARLVAWFSTTRPGRLVSRRVAWRLDPWVLRATGNRFGLAWPLPTALLETRGARTGKPRRNGVVYFHDGADAIVVASLAGAPHHPAWFHNVRARPDEVRLGGVAMRAEVVTEPQERERLWALADRVFPPFAAYRVQAAAAGREIPIVRLRRRS